MFFNVLNLIFKNIFYISLAVPDMRWNATESAVPRKDLLSLSPHASQKLPLPKNSRGR